MVYLLDKVPFCGDLFIIYHLQAHILYPSGLWQWGQDSANYISQALLLASFQFYSNKGRWEEGKDFLSVSTFCGHCSSMRGQLWFQALWPMYQMCFSLGCPSTSWPHLPWWSKAGCTRDSPLNSLILGISPFPFCSLSPRSGNCLVHHIIALSIFP